MRIVTFKVNERLLEEFDMKCKLYGMTRSACLRKLMIQYIGKKELEKYVEVL